MKLKRISLVLLSLAWLAGPAAAFTTAENASPAPVAKPKAAAANEAKPQGAKRGADTAASGSVAGRAGAEAPSKPAPAAKPKP